MDSPRACLLQTMSSPCLCSRCYLRSLFPVYPLPSDLHTPIESTDLIFCNRSSSLLGLTHPRVLTCFARTVVSINSARSLCFITAYTSCTSPPGSSTALYLYPYLYSMTCTLRVSHLSLHPSWCPPLQHRACFNGPKLFFYPICVTTNGPQRGLRPNHGPSHTD